LAGGNLRGWRAGFYAFDLLQLQAGRLTGVQLSERRSFLNEAIADSAIKFSEELSGTPDQIVTVVRQHGLEGVVAKRTESFYEPGKRSGAWVKMPIKQTGTFVLGG